MAKKLETDENQETPEIESAQDKITDKKELVIEKASKKGIKKADAVNIIGEIEPPSDPSDKDEVKAYFKEISEKLDRLLASKPEESDEPEEENIPQPEPKLAWYDRPIL